MIGTMKFRRLPPLAVLHTFEVASSLLSFKEAAEVLHLTPSAISHQMRALEGFVGQPLFHRYNRRLALTEAGERYLAEVRRALESLRDATDELRRGAGIERLTMSVGTFIGTEFVLPRLAGKWPAQGFARRADGDAVFLPHAVSPRGRPSAGNAGCGRLAADLICRLSARRRNAAGTAHETSIDHPTCAA